MTRDSSLVTLEPSPNLRRKVLVRAIVLVACAARAPSQAEPVVRTPDPRWYESAAEMRRLALTWGDEPYGAVIVLNGVLVGQGPSRVVKNQSSDAHAEREAIRDAQSNLGRLQLDGSVLYSTSRPCSVCEQAAARAGVSRMYFGEFLNDAGAPVAAR